MPFEAVQDDHEQRRDLTPPCGVPLPPGCVPDDGPDACGFVCPDDPHWVEPSANLTSQYWSLQGASGDAAGRVTLPAASRATQRLSPGTGVERTLKATWRSGGTATLSVEGRDGVIATTTLQSGEATLAFASTSGGWVDIILQHTAGATVVLEEVHIEKTTHP